MERERERWTKNDRDKGGSKETELRMGIQKEG